VPVGETWCCSTYYDGQVHGFESMRDNLSLYMVYQIKHSKLNMDGTKTTRPKNPIHGESN
jgi:hypothetical protein